MTERFDLTAVNHALRELARLQLAGELDPEAAWRERRQILLGVEAEWEALADQERPPVVVASGDADEGGEVDAAVLTPVVSPTPAQRARSLAARAWHWLLRRSWRMPLWIMLLALALATFSYVGSL